MDEMQDEGGGVDKDDAARGCGDEGAMELELADGVNGGDAVVNPEFSISSSTTYLATYIRLIHLCQTIWRSCAFLCYGVEL